MRGLLDTSVFIGEEASRPLNVALLPDEAAVSVVTVGELRTGVLVARDVEERDRRLTTLMRALSMDPIDVDERVAESWAKLRLLLRDSGRRMRVNDSWIAATAMALNIPVVTRDDDYVELPDLSVIKV